jgi:hypothetical protein
MLHKHRITACTDFMFSTCAKSFEVYRSAQFYCFLFHKSQKSFTVAGPCPAYNADFRIMPNLVP